MMRILLCITTALFCACCSSYNPKDDNSIWYYLGSSRIFYEDDKADSLNVPTWYYYSNGNLWQSVETAPYDTSTYSFNGLYKEYYMDGFPKQSFVYDHGRRVNSVNRDEISKYKIIIDINKEMKVCTEDGDEFLYHEVRIYVDGISFKHYGVSLIDSCGQIMGIGRCPRTLATYIVSHDSVECVDCREVTLDESLYQYLISEEDNRESVVNKNGVQGYLFGFFFKDTLEHISSEPDRTIFVPFNFYEIE